MSQNIAFDKPFETNGLFVGGNGMFIQYHDFVKPVYLFAIIKMILCDQTFGLPVEIIKNMSMLSILEWYVNRRYINPLKQLDWADAIPVHELDSILTQVLNEDESIYKLSPALNVIKLLSVYRQQHMTFPVYVYSPEYEPAIATDCHTLFNGIRHQYMHGDLRECISKCDQNFTYMFADIDMLASAVSILKGSYAYILLADEWRYNYKDYRIHLKHDLSDLMTENPFTRIAITKVLDYESIAKSFEQISVQHKRR